MSEPLMVWLIAVSANLGGMLVIYSFMAFCLARLHWHGRGVGAVLVTIIVAGLFWIAPPAMMDFAGLPAPNSLCFGNCLVSAFAIALSCQSVKGIPRRLEDTARIDGCSWLGIYWHVILPLVGRELGLIAFLMVITTALSFCALLATPGGIDFRPFFEIVGVGTYGAVTMILTVSLIATLPVIAVFFAAKRQLPHTSDAGRTDSVSAL